MAVVLETATKTWAWSSLLPLISARLCDDTMAEIGSTKFRQMARRGLRINERHDLWLWCHSIVHKQLEVGNKSLHGIFETVGRQKIELGI